MPPPRDAPNILRVPGDYEVTTVVHNDTYPAISPRKQDLRGKAIFITGGSRGLGRAMALSYAQAGASTIAVGARSDLSALNTAIQGAATSAGRPPVNFIPVNLDVSSEASVAAAATTVAAATGGKLHVLVNNAGVLGSYGLLADTNVADWLQVIDVNLRGPYLVTRAFLPLLLAAGAGGEAGNERFIVNVTSGGAHLTNPRLSAYQVSKNALLKLSALTDAEYRDQGITAIAIHPGNSPTDIMGGPAAIPEHHKHVFVETPELSGDSVVFLTSESRPWLGGRYVNCTWDLPELVAKKDQIVAGDKLKTKFDY